MSLCACAALAPGSISNITTSPPPPRRARHHGMFWHCRLARLECRAAASLFAVVKAGEVALKAARSASGGGGGDASEGGQALRPADATYLLSALDRMDSVFGIFYEPAGYEAAAGGGGGGEGGDEVPEEMAALLERRLAARESKDWATADAVRDEIKALGYTVKVRQNSMKTE